MSGEQATSRCAYSVPPSSLPWLAVSLILAERGIAAQLSAFTIHGSYRRGTEYIARTAQNARLAQIRIPSHCVRRSRDDLGVSGIVETTLFQDVDGLGRELTFTYAGPTRE